MSGVELGNAFPSVEPEVSTYPFERENPRNAPVRLRRRRPLDGASRHARLRPAGFLQPSFEPR